MGPAQSPELFIPVRLNADGDAVEAGFPQPPQGGGGDAVRIGLKGDLGVGPEDEAPVDLVQQPPQALLAEKARGTAAEVDCVDFVFRGPLGRLLQVEHDGLGIVLHGLAVLAAGQGVEVAVFAFAPAERNVDVDPEGFELLFHRFLLI